MALYPNYYGQQPYPYQDQLSQLRNAPMAMPAQNFQPQNLYKPDNSGFQWVQGEAAAKSWLVTPGTTVLLMDSESMRFYLKSADANGVQAMRTFEYTEVCSVKATEATQPAQYVSVDVFEDFKKQVMGKLDELSEPVEVSLSRKKKGETNE